MTDREEKNEAHQHTRQQQVAWRTFGRQTKTESHKRHDKQNSSKQCNHHGSDLLRLGPHLAEGVPITLMHLNDSSSERSQRQTHLAPRYSSTSSSPQETQGYTP